MEKQKHAYKLIYDALMDDISSGKYAHGERLPTEKELCERYRVSRITSKTALDMLRQQGIVERVRGSGTYVKRHDGQITAAAKQNGHLIGVILPDFSDAFGTGILYAIEQECSKRGSFFLLRRSGADPLCEQRCIEEMIDQGVVGLMVMAQHGKYYSNTILKLIIDRFPIVILDRMYRGVESNFVGTNNLEASEKLARYLLDAGHREIALISPAAENASTLEDRTTGLLNAFTCLGIHPNRNLWFTDVQSTLPMNSTPESLAMDKAALHAHFETYPQITAVFALEYNIAVLVREVASERGLRVPEDLTIVCFDAPGAFFYHGEFSCIKQNQEEIGRRAVELLFDLVHNPDADDEKRIIQIDAQLVTVPDAHER